MKEETTGFSIGGFVELKPKMYSYLADDSSEYKKAKGLNKNVVATVSYNEYKDVLLKKRCLRLSMNRIQIRDHKIGTYEINKISLFCFDHKIYIQSNRCNGLLEIIIKNSYLNNYLKGTFCIGNFFNF